MVTLVPFYIVCSFCRLSVVNYRVLIASAGTPFLLYNFYHYLIFQVRHVLHWLLEASNRNVPMKLP